jgi:PAS domain S-box-containing protein
VNPVASAGFTDDYLKNIKIDLGDKERSQGPTGRAIKSGIYCLANDIANDPKMIPWREHALRHRYKSSAAFPLKVFGKTIGAITLYSDEQFFFDKSEVKLLDEMAMNISFAIEFNENEIKQKLAEEEIKKLNETLEHKVIERTSQLIAANNELKAFTYSVKLASQYSLSLIEASLDPLVTISPEGKITDMNEAFTNITGITRKRLTGSDFFDYFTEQHKAGEVYQEVFAKGSIANSPLTLRHKSGKLTDVLFNGSVYKDDRGNIQGVVIVARDVTVQKRIENELIEAKVFAEIASLIAEKAKSKAESATQIAENAVKAKQQFLSNMSHEIRTPMNAIIGFTKVVLKTNLTAKQKEYLTAIKMSGDLLIVLINDILDLAKVDAGKMTFEQIPFKMALSISAMLHLFETKIQEKNLTLVKEYDTKIPEVLVGDPVRLHQIILNLVGNAVKFTTKGKITVSVCLLSEDDEKATIEFAVSDTGIGIQENKIGKIFDNFQQATSDTSRLFGGTGLGLAIVKQLVEPQGGSISVKSKLDEGSTFSFILSFIKTNAETVLETKIEELNTEIKNIKVLVAEDIPLNQLLMKTLLDEFGFERDIADNGKIAIEKLQNNPYDIILMDLQMPEMNGFEATEYIRNTMNSKIPILALTADVTTVDLAKCKAVGMNDYISKPVDERLLYSKIIELLKKSVLI